MDDDALIPVLLGAPAPVVVALLAYMILRDALRERRRRKRGRHEL